MLNLNIHIRMRSRVKVEVASIYKSTQLVYCISNSSFLEELGLVSRKEKQNWSMSELEQLPKDAKLGRGELAKSEWTGPKISNSYQVQITAMLEGTAKKKENVTYIYFLTLNYRRK